jgi:hypothetical protein
MVPLWVRLQLLSLAAQQQGLLLLCLLLLALAAAPAGLFNTRLFSKMTFRYPFALFTYIMSTFMGLTEAQVCGWASCRC